jgi:hypothetical protein
MLGNSAQQKNPKQAAEGRGAIITPLHETNSEAG